MKKTSLTFLGHEISQSTIKPSPSRLRPILDYASPSNFKQLERFLGLAIYHSKWVPDFSSLAASLFDVKAVKGPFPLSAICGNSIQLIKQAIAASLLAVPDPNKLLRLETDASGTSIAATLLQEGRPVAFFSHRLTPREKAWSAMELEAFAVVAACDKLRHFLLGREFEVVVDQQGVSFLFNGKPKSAVKNAKLSRWRLQMLDYRFIIVYHPGHLNTVADALSHCSAISSPLANHDVIKKLHESMGHPGSSPLQAYLLPYHEISVNEILKVTNDCKICAEVKPRFFRPPLGKLIHATAPWQRISIDFIGPKASYTANHYLFTVIDEYSRYPFAFPVFIWPSSKRA